MKYLMKLQISMDDKLVERIDRYADENYMTRSGLITLAASQYLNSNDVILLVKDISLAIRKIADNGDVDVETVEKLEDFERLCKLLTSSK